MLAEVFGVEPAEFLQRRRNSSLRGVAARFLIQYAGVTQREAAVVLKTGSGAAVSHQLWKLAVEVERDRLLQRRIEEAERRLEEAQATTER